MPIVQAPVSSVGVQDPTRPADNSPGAVDFDTFLQLLTAQLENQDPLNPVEGTEWTSQIAQFSSLEQQMASNSFLEQLANQTDYSIQSMALSYIGNEALAKGNTMTLSSDGQATDFAYTLDRAAQVAQAEISGIVNGQTIVVRTMDIPAGAGEHAVTWDGLDDDGNPVAAGTYIINISAVAPEGGSVRSDIYTYSRVQAMAGQGSEATLQLEDNRAVEFNEILSVRAPQDNNAG